MSDTSREIESLKDCIRVEGEFGVDSIEAIDERAGHREQFYGTSRKLDHSVRVRMARLRDWGRTFDACGAKLLIPFQREWAAFIDLSLMVDGDEHEVKVEITTKAIRAKVYGRTFGATKWSATAAEIVAWIRLGSEGRTAATAEKAATDAAYSAKVIAESNLVALTRDEVKSLDRALRTSKIVLVGADMRGVGGVPHIDRSLLPEDHPARNR